MIKLVIFDIAGTLIEDHNEVAESFLLDLRSNNIQVTEEEIKEWKGSSKREVISHFVARQFGACRNLALIDRTFNEFRYLLEQRYSAGVAPIAGIEEALSELRSRGRKLTTTTGFYREIRDRILNTLCWRDRFDSHVCSDDVAHGRPAPEMIQCAMQLCGVNDPLAVANVGDTPLDLQSAANAGCRLNVGVLTGLHGCERLTREPHTHLLPSATGVPELLKRLS